MSNESNQLPSPPASGWLTPEHCQSVLKQGIALLVTLGVLQTADADNLSSQLTACITAAFIFAFNAYQVMRFVDAQVQLKGWHFDLLAGRKPTLPVVLLLSLLLAGPASAQCPCGPGCLCGPCPCTPTSLLPWRSQLEQQLKSQQQLISRLQGQLEGQQHPAQPIIIQQPAPLPIQGAPQQSLPIQGAPLQPLPIAGTPQLLLPIEGNPHLLVPIHGAPQQALPTQPTPVPQPQPQPRTLPPAPAPGQPQSYTTRFALYRPQGRNR
jgi:hypothetical protein